MTEIVVASDDLISLIINCVSGKIDLEDLVNYKSDFDEELWEVEGLCALMRTDVLKLVNDSDIIKLFIGTYSMSSDKVRQSFINLIDSLMSELKTSKEYNWGEHENVGMFLEEMIDFGGKVIDEICAEIFEYIGAVVEVSEDEKFTLLTVKVFSTYSTSKVKCWLIRRLDWLMTQLNDEVVDWTRHRNVCEVIWAMLRSIDGDGTDKHRKYYSIALDQEVSELIFAYMMKLLDCEEHDRAKVMAIVNLELMCVTNRVDRENQHSLRLKLSNVAEKVEFVSLTNQQFNSDEYQLGWCARWSVDNLWDEEGRFDRLPLVKLSTDRFEARNDTVFFTTVRSSFGVTSGVYFYEVVCITPGNIRIGWSTRDATYGWWNENYKLGDDENSIAFDVVLGQIVHNRISHPIASLPPHKSLDVVGCLIDTHNRQFVFYHNGCKIDCPINLNYSTSPYYATVSLCEHQQCRFNFGQENFKHSPKEINFDNFNELTNGDARKFQLIDTEKNDFINWFKHPLVDNKVDILYRDSKQNEHDDFVRQNEHNIANAQTHKIDLTHIECTRFIQSVIEVMHTELNDDECIQEIMKKQLTLSRNMELNTFTGKMFELIYPYTQLQPIPENRTKCHNLGIILISILNLFPHIPPEIYQMSLKLLLSIKLISIETLKKNAQLVTRALSGFDAFRLNDRDKRMLLKNQNFTLTLEGIERYGQLVSISSLYEQSYDSQTLQAAICAKWWIDRLISGESESQPRRATLNPTDRSALLKLSSDRLSARSDFHWQSVRSIDHVPSDLYYFEVILLTDGPMRIGWATKRTDLNESQIGKDSFSISFDGFAPAVRHQGEVYQQPDIAPWKAGDVVGCTIDKNNRQFSFSLNGQTLSLPSNLHFSSLPYHGAVSLSPHQQVYFNFGQQRFKFAPEQTDYWNFHLALSHRENQNQTFKPIMDFRNAKLSSAYISVHSRLHTRDISIKSSSKSRLRDSESIKPNKKAKLDVALDYGSIQSTSKDSQSIYCLEPHQSVESVSKVPTIQADYSFKITHKWTIKNFSLFSNENSATLLPVIYSESFPSSKLFNFFLRILPNCANNDQMSYISLFLYLENNRLEKYLKIPVNYKVSIVNSEEKIVYFQEKSENFQQEESWGWEKFIEKDRLREFLQNHQLSLVCELSIDSNEIYTEIHNKEPISLFYTENSFECNKKINRLTYPWKINDFTLYFYDQQAPKYVKSDTFPAQAHKSINKYYLRLWPKGIDEESSQFVSLYLTLETSEQNEKILVQYRVSVLNRRGSVFHTGEGRIYSNSDTDNSCKIKGSSKFLPLEQIINPENGLLPGDILTIYCEIWEIMDHEIYEKKNQDEKELQKMCEP